LHPNILHGIISQKLILFRLTCVLYKVNVEYSVISQKIVLFMDKSSLGDAGKYLSLK
jgi:hypothetical protein